MSCELIANGQRYGCGDGDACTVDKQIGVPEKRIVREDVPYHNGSYDFSEIDGEDFYEDRVLKYTFGVVGSEQRVLEQVSELTTWLYSIHDADIWDTDIPYWHFHGSCDKVKVDFDESGMSADIEATFTVEPFLIADSFSEHMLFEGANYVLNRSRKARLYLVSDEGDEPVLSIGGVEQKCEGGTWLDLSLETGQNVVNMRGCEKCLVAWQERRL